MDAVIVSGTEGGGHSGFDQLTTLCLVPQAVDILNIPVIAGGGIVDSRGLMAALAMGADGIYMGTRFMASQECPTHDKVKQAILAAADTSTIAVRHGSPVLRKREAAGVTGFVEERRGSVRLVINDFLEKVMTEIDGPLTVDQIFAAAGRSGGEFRKQRHRGRLHPRRYREQHHHRWTGIRPDKRYPHLPGNRRTHGSGSRTNSSTASIHSQNRLTSARPEMRAFFQGRGGRKK